MSEQQNVVITGFGLFRDHQLNPSWEAIRDGQLQIDRPNLNIITKQVEVAYEAVDKEVEQLWAEYNPILMVHVGLAAHEKEIRIEQMARHGPYLHDDVVENAPHKDLRLYDQGEKSLEENIIPRCYSCKPCEFDRSITCVDVDEVCRKAIEAHKNGDIPLSSTKSCDAGLYLCEYIYQKSLRICDRTVFIHVPDTKNFKIEDIRASLKHVIELVLDQILDKA